MSFPSLSPPCSCFVEPMTFTQAARLLAGRSETTTFPTLVNWVDDPVDMRITTYGLMFRVNQDDFEVFVRRVLVDPV